MGKSQKKNKTKVRVNPIAKQVKPPSDPELAAIREKQILPVLKDLTSPDLKARSTAARAITNLIDSEKCRKLLLREKLVTILLEQTITDLNLETKAAGWGILRNLTIEEEADFCIHLYRLDILTAINGMIRNIIETIESSDFATTPKAHKDLVWNITGSIVTLLSSLSEAQDEIIEAVSKIPNLANFLFGLLGLAELPAVVFEDTLTCLIVLTEDNEAICQQIVANEAWLKGLVQLKDGGSMKAVGACGVLHNVFSTMHWFDHNTPVQGASDGNLVPILTRCIEKANTPEAQTNGNTSHATPDQVLQLAFQIMASIATSLQEALAEGKKEEPFEGFGEDGDDEMIMEDGSDLDDEEGRNGNTEEAEDPDEEDEMNDDEILADMERVAGEGSEADETEDEQVTLNNLVRIAAPVILAYAQPPQIETAEVTESRTNALSVLNNISWTLSSIDFSSSHLSKLQSAWTELAHQIWLRAISPVLASNTADIPLASSITSLAFGIAQSLQGKVPLQGVEQRKFMALYVSWKNLPEDQKKDVKLSHADEEDVFQGLGVKCIGVLGRLALDPAPIDLNREIGAFLLTSLPDAEAAETVEILNQIFDIYADKEFACDEGVFWADGFYQHLDQALPKVRKLFKGIDKRKFAELRDRGDDVVRNLQRFLTYKKQERRGR